MDIAHPKPFHEDRDRALSFGGVAALYDRARPSYPAALIDDLMAWGPRHVLDVGCGTGKAARLLAERGCDVLGVEPDPLMASVARDHGIAVEDGTFEEWDARGRRFDLIVSGQAWHWVDPELGTAKAADVLRDGGHIALFWNGGRHDPATHAALESVYMRVAPTIAGTTTSLRPVTADGGDRFAAFERSGSYSMVEVRAYPWDAVYDRAGWLDYIATHSDHVQLPDAERRMLLDAVGDLIDAQGGTLTYHFSTVAIVATRGM